MPLFHSASIIRVTLTASLSLSALVLFPAPLLAQDTTAPIENSKFSAQGKINSNQVFVRSGPSENDYPVMKLDKDSQVTVVGMKFEWLKVVPPEGSFCYVGKAWVDRHGDGSQGRVTNNLNVRVGSQLNSAMSTKLATRLEAGAPVEIMGEQDQYYKIKPPADVYFYVNKQYVDAVQVIPPGDQPRTADAGAGANGEQPKEDSVAHQQPNTPDDTGGGGTWDEASSERSAEIAGSPTTAPSTAPSQIAQAEAEFDRVESMYADNAKKPLDEQDITVLQASYEKLATSDAGLPETLRRVAEAKAAYLKTRVKDREQYVAVKQRQIEMKQKQTALEAERNELEQRLRANEVKAFTAIGTLRPSSLQQGATMLYRLTDPATGRTVVYIRSSDPKIAALLGQFMGVRGEMTDDVQLSLRVITPASFEAVEIAKVNSGIAAQVMPPSMMPGAGQTATTGGE